MDSDDDYGFGYSDDDMDEDENELVELQNLYYQAKSEKLTEKLRAIETFEKVLSTEASTSQKGEWGFKALKQLIKLHFSLKNYEAMLIKYEVLLTYVKSAVTKNYSEKSINSILDRISVDPDKNLLHKFYTLTLNTLKESKNDRLWFKTNLKLAKLYFDFHDFAMLQKAIKELHLFCQTESGDDDLSKGTQLLEIYALEIQMHTEQKNDKVLRALYRKCLHIKSAIPHPYIMGVIRECGGKMHLRETEFSKAYEAFFEAFKCYEESGASRRNACLKYLVLASMLQKSCINPFESQEAKPYKNDPEIEIMAELLEAYQSNNVTKFEHVVQANYDHIMADAFVKEHLEELLENVRSEVVLLALRAYSRVTVDFLAKKLSLKSTDVVCIVEVLIQKDRLKAKLDKVDNIIIIDRKEMSKAPPVASYQSTLSKAVTTEAEKNQKAVKQTPGSGRSGVAASNQADDAAFVENMDVWGDRFNHLVSLWMEQLGRMQTNTMRRFTLDAQAVGSERPTAGPLAQSDVIGPSSNEHSPSFIRASSAR